MAEIKNLIARKLSAYAIYYCANATAMFMACGFSMAPLLMACGKWQSPVRLIVSGVPAGRPSFFLHKGLCVSDKRTNVAYR